MTNQGNTFYSIPLSLTEMFANNNYLDELQDTEFKGTIINFIKYFKEFTEYTNKQFNEIKKKELLENKHLCDSQENTNLMFM